MISLSSGWQKSKYYGHPSGLSACSGNGFLRDEAEGCRLSPQSGGGSAEAASPVLTQAGWTLYACVRELLIPTEIYHITGGR